MVIKSEQLLESIMDLERSRQRERDTRIETEALLKGLEGITGAGKKEDIFPSLINALRHVIDFEEAFLLQTLDANTMNVLASSFHPVMGSIWHPGSVFKRSLSGRPVASFDIDLISEWQQQPQKVKQKIRSALHIGLHGGDWEGMLIITHSQPKYFGVSHINKAKKFSPLASQALLTLELQQALTQRNRFFDLTMDLMAIFQADGKLQQFNEGWSTLLGFDTLSFHTSSLFDLVHPDDVESLEAVIDFLNKGGGKTLVEIRFLKKNNTYCWLSCSLASYQDEQLFYVVARDITDSVLYEQRLAHAVRHDALTGLNNRAAFMDALGHAFDLSTRRKDYSFALFFLDLNDFKTINDTMGHDIGDELLKTFAGILRDSVREGDTAARLGGDEFTLIVNSMQSEKCVTNVAERIRTKCLQPLDLKGKQIQISVSIGVALSNACYKNADTLLQDADQAMYQAKNNKNLPLVIASPKAKTQQ